MKAENTACSVSKVAFHWVTNSQKQTVYAQWGQAEGMVSEPRNGDGAGRERPGRSPEGRGSRCSFLLEFPDKIQDGLSFSAVFVTYLNNYWLFIWNPDLTEQPVFSFGEPGSPRS